MTAKDILKQLLNEDGPLSVPLKVWWPPTQQWEEIRAITFDKDEIKLYNRNDLP